MLFGVYVLWSCYSGKCLNKDNLLIYYIVLFLKKKKKEECMVIMVCILLFRLGVRIINIISIF